MLADRRNAPIRSLLIAAAVVALVFALAACARPHKPGAASSVDSENTDFKAAVFYYDYDEMTPGPIFSTTEELVDWVEHLDERFDASEVAAFRERFMSACDGHATERIVAAMLGE